MPNGVTNSRFQLFYRHFLFNSVKGKRYSTTDETQNRERPDRRTRAADGAAQRPGSPVVFCLSGSTVAAAVPCCGPP